MTRWIVRVAAVRPLDFVGDAVAVVVQTGGGRDLDPCGLPPARRCGSIRIDSERIHVVGMVRPREPGQDFNTYTCTEFSGGTPVRYGTAPAIGWPTLTGVTFVVESRLCHAQGPGVPGVGVGNGVGVTTRTTICAVGPMLPTTSASCTVNSESPSGNAAVADT